MATRRRATATNALPNLGANGEARVKPLLAMPPLPALTRKTIALVGLMGVGKSSIGRRLGE